MRRLCLLFLVSLLLALSCRHEPSLPKLFMVPDTALVSDSGKPVNLSEMKGHVTVYDFIFTSCAGICPVMTANMRKLTEKIDDGAPVRFVSISVDPQRDTPAVLHEYASRFRNDDRWYFLTGDRDAIVKLSIEGFKLAAGGTPAPGGEPILHSSKFAVADRNGIIRAYHDGTEAGSTARVEATVSDLLDE